MTAELIQAQATDVFRIGLLVALLATMHRTRAATGTVLPLLAGILFVAIIVPATQGSGAGVSAPLWMQVASGIVVNAAYVLVGLAVMRLVLRRG